MTSKEVKRLELFRTLSRSIVYAAPLMVAVAGYASVHSIVADASSTDGYQMTAVAEADSEAEPEAEADSEAEAEAEAEAPDAEPESETEQEAEAE